MLQFISKDPNSTKGQQTLVIQSVVLWLSHRSTVLVNEIDSCGSHRVGLESLTGARRFLLCMHVHVQGQPFLISLAKNGGQPLKNRLSLHRLF